MITALNGYSDLNDIIPTGQPEFFASPGYQLIKCNSVFAISNGANSNIFSINNNKHCFEINGLLIHESNDDLISFSNTLKMIFVWDKISGRKKVEYETDNFLLASILIQGNILSYTRSKQLCLFNYLKNSDYWKIDMPDRVDSIRSNQESIFYTNRKDTIVCRDLSSRKEKWSFNISLIGKHQGIDGEESGKVGSDLYLFRNLVITYVFSSKIIAINQSSGELEWELSLNGKFATSNMTSDGILYCLESYANSNIAINIYEIDVSKGEILRQKDFTKDIQNSVGKPLSHLSFGGLTVTDKGLFFSLLEDQLILKINRSNFRVDWFHEHNCSINAHNLLINSNRIFFIDHNRDVFSVKGE